MAQKHNSAMKLMQLYRDYYIGRSTQETDLSEKKKIIKKIEKKAGIVSVLKTSATYVEGDIERLVPKPSEVNNISLNNGRMNFLEETDMEGFYNTSQGGSTMSSKQEFECFAYWGKVLLDLEDQKEKQQNSELKSLPELDFKVKKTPDFAYEDISVHRDSGEEKPISSPIVNIDRPKDEPLEIKDDTCLVSKDIEAPKATEPRQEIQIEPSRQPQKIQPESTDPVPDLFDQVIVDPFVDPGPEPEVPKEEVKLGNLANENMKKVFLDYFNIKPDSIDSIAEDMFLDTEDTMPFGPENSILEPISHGQALKIQKYVADTMKSSWTDIKKLTTDLYGEDKAKEVRTDLLELYKQFSTQNFETNLDDTVAPNVIYERRISLMLQSVAQFSKSAVSKIPVPDSIKNQEYSQDLQDEIDQKIVLGIQFAEMEERGEYWELDNFFVDFLYQFSEDSKNYPSVTDAINDYITQTFPRWYKNKYNQILIESKFEDITSPYKRRSGSWMKGYLKTILNPDTLDINTSHMFKLMKDKGIFDRIVKMMKEVPVYSEILKLFETDKSINSLIGAPLASDNPFINVLAWLVYVGVIAFIFISFGGAYKLTSSDYKRVDPKLVKHMVRLGDTGKFGDPKEINKNLVNTEEALESLLKNLDDLSESINSGDWAKVAIEHTLNTDLRESLRSSIESIRRSSTKIIFENKKVDLKIHPLDTIDLDGKYGVFTRPVGDLFPNVKLAYQKLVVKYEQLFLSQELGLNDRIDVYNKTVTTDEIVDRIGVENQKFEPLNVKTFFADCVAEFASASIRDSIALQEYFIEKAIENTPELVLSNENSVIIRNEFVKKLGGTLLKSIFGDSEYIEEEYIERGIKYLRESNQGQFIDFYENYMRDFKAPTISSTWRSLFTMYDQLGRIFGWTDIRPNQERLKEIRSSDNITLIASDSELFKFAGVYYRPIRSYLSQTKDLRVGDLSLSLNPSTKKLEDTFIIQNLIEKGPQELLKIKERQELIDKKYLLEGTRFEKVEDYVRTVYSAFYKNRDNELNATDLISSVIGESSIYRETLFQDGFMNGIYETETFIQEIYPDVPEIAEFIRKYFEVDHLYDIFTMFANVNQNIIGGATNIIKTKAFSESTSFALDVMPAIATDLYSIPKNFVSFGTGILNTGFTTITSYIDKWIKPTNDVSVAQQTKPQDQDEFLQKKEEDDKFKREDFIDFSWLLLRHFKYFSKIALLISMWCQLNTEVLWLLILKLGAIEPAIDYFQDKIDQLVFVISKEMRMKAPAEKVFKERALAAVRDVLKTVKWGVEGHVAIKKVIILTSMAVSEVFFSFVMFLTYTSSFVLKKGIQITWSTGRVIYNEYKGNTPEKESGINTIKEVQLPDIEEKKFTVDEFMELHKEFSQRATLIEQGKTNSQVFIKYLKLTTKHLREFTRNEFLFYTDKGKSEYLRRQLMDIVGQGTANHLFGSELLSRGINSPILRWVKGQLTFFWKMSFSSKVIVGKQNNYGAVVPPVLFSWDIIKVLGGSITDLISQKDSPSPNWSIFPNVLNNTPKEKRHDKVMELTSNLVITYCTRILYSFIIAGSGWVGSIPYIGDIVNVDLSPTTASYLYLGESPEASKKLIVARTIIALMSGNKDMNLEIQSILQKSGFI